MSAARSRDRVGSVHITHRSACMDREAHFELFSMRVRAREQKLGAKTSRVTLCHHNPQHWGLSCWGHRKSSSCRITTHLLTDSIPVRWLVSPAATKQIRVPRKRAGCFTMPTGMTCCLRYMHAVLPSAARRQSSLSEDNPSPLPCVMPHQQQF